MELRLVFLLNREGDTIESWFCVITEEGEELRFNTWSEVEEYLSGHG